VICSVLPLGVALPRAASRSESEGLRNAQYLCACVYFAYGYDYEGVRRTKQSCL
jgi:hypothetical protein